MKKIKINFGKVAFLLCNFIFLLSGICLVLLGCVLVNDAPRILLSRLVLEPGLISQPLLYYVALAFIAAGLIVCAVAMLGCWAAWAPDSNWLMGTYIFLLIILLLGETSFGAVASLCPQIIGVTADRDQMVTGLMNNYGVPGRSQYTAAVDLAQTLFECCGMQSGSDYDGSKWWRREQESQHDLRVPHSCCFLSNTDDENSFLDPKPINSSLCQAKTNSRYQYGRHVKGCIDKLNAWFKDHVTIFLIIGLALVIVQLAVLLCAILICLRKSKDTNSSPVSSRPENSKSSKKFRRSEKNLTPKPERKNGSAQIEVRDSNGFTVGKNHPSHSDFFINSKSASQPSKKLNSNEDFGEIRIRDSTSSLPLVLRNEHFHKYEGGRNKENLDSVRKNSPIMQEYMHYDQGVYFTPHYTLTGRRGERIFYKPTDNDYNLNGDLKNYFSKSDHYGVDNNSRGLKNENKDKIINDRFESEWVPSHQPESLEKESKLEPWNTIGIPLNRNSMRGSRQIVRKAVRDIESGLYSSGYQDRRKEVVEEKIDVTQARLYWQEKERGSHDVDIKVPASIDYRTDYPAEGERDENVIVLKVDQSDGLILKPNKPIILTPIQAVKLRKKSVDEEDEGGDSEKENLPSYEGNWSQKRNDMWSCDVTRNSRRRVKEEEEKRLGEVASRVLKFESTGYPNEIGQIKSQIPRIKTVKPCELCKKIAVVDKCSKCGAVKSSSRETRQNGNYSPTDFKLPKKKTISKEKPPKDRLLISVDSQRSRTNFFGNSGSYTLRCNLNPVTKVTYNKKRFYLTPETLQWDYLKKLKESKIFYENFAAKKREFLKQKADSSINRLDGYEKKSEAGLW